MPSGRRQIEPLSTAIAASHENCTMFSFSSLRMGTPRTPNISHTANSSVKAVVDRARTRVEAEGGGSGGFMPPVITAGWFPVLQAIVGDS